jgi:hypothetical protein
MTNATTITSLDQLSAAAPTRINPNTNVTIPGTYLDFDGNKTNSCARGARWTLRAEGTDARIRDLVIG